MMADADLAKAQVVQCLFTLFDGGKRLRSYRPAIFNPR